MTAMLAVILSGPFPAGAEQTPDTPSGGAVRVGQASLVEGEVGSVIVQRDGATYSLGSGDPVFLGDRISTSGVGRVVLNVTDCRRVVEPMSTIVLTGDLCVVPITQIDSPGILSGGTISTSAVVATGAGALGLYVATRDNDDGGEDPVSR
ncbi:hypothetical protein ACQKH5_17185 [Hyphomonas sp. NPDC076900]|uniref:hypothetical protein n=1 Tax=unclassified Hyphomonas TaxID=2630699 RepID=UPI003CFCD255